MKKLQTNNAYRFKIKAKHNKKNRVSFGHTVSV